MKVYIFIGAGGFIGAVIREIISKTHIYSYYLNMPLNTLLINILGSFLLGLILTIFMRDSCYKEHMKLLTTVGFLGAFTTFSSLCKEAYYVLDSQNYIALIYIVLSISMGLLGVYYGENLANKLKIETFTEKIEG